MALWSSYLTKERQMSINFCHIAPVSYLPLVRHYPVHLLLAHLVEENKEYREFYIKLKQDNPNVFYHLDNSAFEMFKRGQPMYDPSKLIEMGKLVNADSIVMSDYPKEYWQKTVLSAQILIPELKKEGFKTFFCPQSELGDLDGLMKSYEWAIDNPDVNYIGVSILACPIALGVNESKHGDGSRDESYRMQRYLSRWAIFQELDRRGLLGYQTEMGRFHCLGMTDGPKEIELLSPFHEHIFSWDSSSAVWHGINGIEYDKSPTGLRSGKFELEVDFDIAPASSIENVYSLCYNMGVIDKMCEGR
jgi:hypothetical protein